jgi:hypothetical protein
MMLPCGAALKFIGGSLARNYGPRKEILALKTHKAMPG